MLQNFHGSFKLIPDVIPLRAAAHKTLISKSLTTHVASRTTHITSSWPVLVLLLMTAVEKLIKGKEIDLDELEGWANQTHIQKISNVELGISSTADAIVCRIAARDAL
ncbi:unnamed protein product [Ilex paraguariensis]|uniref:Uncharacterized protein n=1 Tax=Ilex paraguariensis TaxID=185542 RepID=A0ABC8SH19_9AQUA